ncbi:MAG TPA: methionyl-tRNA formyltransferase [Caulobacteraceae bacterium]|jgi:methionyl-tRNA formyltransferase
MRLVFLGTPEFSVPVLSAIIAAKYDIVCVYSQPPAPRGRGRQLAPSAVQAFAEAHGLSVRTPASLREPEEARAFAALGLDAAVVVAFGQILTRDILEAPRLGCFNLHASLLPRWRGAAPIQRAIMAGDAITGVDVMRVDEGLDTGPTLASASTRIDALDTAGSLADRLSKLGASLMVEALAALEGGEARFTPQPGDGATYARKIRPAEARIRWDRSGERVDRQIRGLSPFPGAWFEAPGPKGPMRIKAMLSRLEAGAGEAGEVLDDGLLIACGEGAVRILKAQREGRGAQDGGEFVRGFPLNRGVRVS